MRVTKASTESSAAGGDAAAGGMADGATGGGKAVGGPAHAAKRRAAVDGSAAGEPNDSIERAVTATQAAPPIQGEPTTEPATAAVSPGVVPWNRVVLRSFNERTLLDSLRAAGAASRAELARTTGLSKPTVSSALANLEQSGLVRQTGEMVQQGRGRSAVLYEANPTAGYVLGLDIGRSWIRAAVADLDGTIVGRRDRRNTARGAGATVHRAAELARAAVAEAGVDGSRLIQAVVGSPGVIDPASHRVRLAPNLPGWSGSGVFEQIQDELGVAAEVVNDANLAALGEYTFGAGRGCRLFVYLMIGTGAGSGIVVDGKLFRGNSGAAGEVGYLPMHPLPTADEAEESAHAARATDPVSRRGLLEDAVAADAVVRLGRSFGLEGVTSAKDVFQAARRGNAAAQAAVDHEGARLGHLVAALAAVLDPELVVLGGGVGRNTDLLVGPVEKALRALSPLRPRIEPSALGEDSVLLGAIATAVEIARDHTFDTHQSQ
jgi:predicted NBD/HSP70 family sugar kinase